MTAMTLNDFDADAFLRDYWQRQPLLIRNPWRQWRNPLDPDDLAGLACEPGIESRLITGTRDALTAEDGPLPEDRFGRLDRAPWTLLVQAVDQHVPAVAALIEPFRFIPDWRIDDVMVSVAGDGGGVGAHFDHYDVFLVQGLGRRRWQVGARCDDDTALLPHDSVRLLADFQPTDEWLLEPGDILYVPPGVAHNGVAVGDNCMTYSIGFRAPSRGELIGGWADDLLAGMTDDDRYADPGLRRQANPGEIAPAAIDRLHALVTEKLGDRAAFARWFGEYASTPKYPEIDWSPETAIGVDDLDAYLAHGVALIRNPASRFSFIAQGAGAVLLFVDGESWLCEGATATLAVDLCADLRLTFDADRVAPGALRALLLDLINAGSLGFDDRD